MFKTLAIQPENGFFACPAPNYGISLFGAGLCGSPLSAISMAIVIIPNYAGMFNENRTFFGKN